MLTWLMISAAIMSAWIFYERFIDEPRSKKRRQALHELVNRHRADRQNHR